MKYVTRREALRRMANGDLPTQGGGYTSALHFDDGTRTTGRTGWQLVREGLIERPAHSSVHSPYTLAGTFHMKGSSNDSGGRK